MNVFDSHREISCRVWFQYVVTSSQDYRQGLLWKHWIFCCWIQRSFSNNRTKRYQCKLRLKSCWHCSRKIDAVLNTVTTTFSSSLSDILIIDGKVCPDWWWREWDHRRPGRSANKICDISLDRRLLRAIHLNPNLPLECRTSAYLAGKNSKLPIKSEVTTGHVHHFQFVAESLGFDDLQRQQAFSKVYRNSCNNNWKVQKNYVKRGR